MTTAAKDREIVQTAACKLTNQLNAIVRAKNMTREEKVFAVDSILSAQPKAG